MCRKKCLTHINKKVSKLEQPCFLDLLGLDAVQRHGRARLGDRTLIDALHPALDQLIQHLESVQNGNQTLVNFTRG